MPKYYCDYCDIFLTHDSPSVRRAHNAGWKHLMHVRNYYAELPQEKTQNVVDNLTKSYEARGLPLPPHFSNPAFPFGQPFSMPMVLPPWLQAADPSAPSPAATSGGVAGVPGLPSVPGLAMPGAPPPVSAGSQPDVSSVSMPPPSVPGLPPRPPMAFPGMPVPGMPGMPAVGTANGQGPVPIKVEGAGAA